AALARQNEAAMFAMMALQQLIGQAVGTFLFVGLIMFMLRIARGEEVEYGALFSGGRYFVYAFAIQILTMLAVFVGFILLIIPMFIFGLMLSQAQFMLIDQQTGIIDSLRLSIAAMRGNKLTVFAIWMVAGVIGLVLSLVTCFVGFIFVGPYLMLLMAVIYLGVTGQQTVLELNPPAPNLAERGFGTQGA
ncbi:MAG TPA: hypothetical protein VFW87_11865, partial [Pirellulales bacterium]|nr:hypothetical protein [Pirellulales bacterium]